MTTPDRPTAFLSRRFPESIEQELGRRFHLRVNHDDSILSVDELVHQARGADVLFVTATERLPADALFALQGSANIVATLSVGLDHIDLLAAQAAGISVLNTPDVLSDACADLAMMLVLNACRRGYEADQLVRSGQWAGWAPTQLLGLQLKGRRLGIFGMGRIGRCIAERARAFGLKIHYHNRRPLEDTGDAVYHATLEGLMAQSDIFLVAAPGTPELKGIVDRERIALLPDGAVVVNISRGDLIDDQGLINALQTGAVFAAGLDVFANEPAVNPGYRRLSNVFLTPHIGSATNETREAMGWLLINGIDQLRQGKTPLNLVV